MLGRSLSIRFRSRHNSVVCAARTHLRLCLLPAKWEHVVPTYIQSGLTEIEVAHNMARRVATPRRRSKRKRMRRRRRRRRLKGRRRRRREEEGGGRMPVTGVSRCRRPGNLKRTILPPTSLEIVKQHDFVNNTETVSSSKLLPRAVAQNLLFLFECSGSADAQRRLFLIEIHRVLSGVHGHVPSTDNSGVMFKNHGRCDRTYARTLVGHVENGQHDDGVYMSSSCAKPWWAH